MECTDVQGHHWKHHAWHRRVTSARREVRSHGDMWGRSVEDEHVLCHTEEVCAHCGATRKGAECMCDTAKGEQCALLLAWQDRTGETLA